jgi:hypothetical protein
MTSIIKYQTNNDSKIKPLPPQSKKFGGGQKSFVEPLHFSHCPKAIPEPAPITIHHLHQKISNK